MDPDQDQEISGRDAFWMILSQLRPAIDALLAGTLAGSEHERQLAQVLAQAVKMELDFRDRASGKPTV